MLAKEQFLWSNNLEDLKDEHRLKTVFLVGLLWTIDKLLFFFFIFRKEIEALFGNSKIAFTTKQFSKAITYQQECKEHE